MYVRDPRRVAVGGPLAPFAEGFCWEVLGCGYLPRSACQWLQLTAVLSRWLSEQVLEPSDLSEPAIVRFCGDFKNRYRKPMNRRGLDALLIYLRGLGVVPVPVDDVPLGPAALLLADYRRYLIEERALAARSVRRYLPAAAAFIAGLTDLSQAGLARLSAADVTTFVLEQASRRGVADAKSMVSALRSLLRHWFVSGQIEHELWRAVPTVLDRKFRTVPGRLDDGVVDVLTASCDRAACRGRRDYAILTVLSRLGLRACEVAAMLVDDVDWRTGVLTVHGKGGRVELLPLPNAVGEALVDYLLHGRPGGLGSRHVFLADRAPFGPLSDSAIRAVVARSCRRVGITRVGAHRLRHTVAADLLQAGSSLAEVGQVLRHRSGVTTAIYAKVDYARLQTLALPWPGAGP